MGRTRNINVNAKKKFQKFGELSLQDLQSYSCFRPSRSDDRLDLDCCAFQISFFSFSNIQQQPRTKNNKNKRWTLFSHHGEPKPKQQQKQLTSRHHRARLRMRNSPGLMTTFFVHEPRTAVLPARWLLVESKQTTKKNQQGSASPQQGSASQFTRVISMPQYRIFIHDTGRRAQVVSGTRKSPTHMVKRFFPRVNPRCHRRMDPVSLRPFSANQQTRPFPTSQSGRSFLVKVRGNADADGQNPWGPPTLFVKNTPSSSHNLGLPQKLRDFQIKVFSSKTTLSSP